MHFHALALDGVYAAGDSRNPEFHPLPAPEDDEVMGMAEDLARRIPALLARRRLNPDHGDPEESDPFARAQPGLAAMVAASVVGRVSTGSNAGGRVAAGGDRLQYAPVPAAGGAVNWSTINVASTKPATSINNLTPGVIYTVRGFSDWSGTAERMAI